MELHLFRAVQSTAIGAVQQINNVRGDEGWMATAFQVSIEGGGLASPHGAFQPACKQGPDPRRWFNARAVYAPCPPHAQVSAPKTGGEQGPHT